MSYLRRDTRLGLRATLEALSDTAIRMLGVTGACAAAGLVIGGITMTGLASKFSFVAFALAGDSVVLALLLSAAVTIILGLGMPTPSAYVLAAVLVGPTLVNDYGFQELNAHLFLLYFAVMSAMTPPVAVAAYAAAAISLANPLRIAVIAMRFSIVAFLVPFMFVINPLMLSPFASLEGFATSLAAVLACILIAFGSEWHGGGQDRAAHAAGHVWRGLFARRAAALAQAAWRGAWRGALDLLPARVSSDEPRRGDPTVTFTFSAQWAA